MKNHIFWILLGAILGHVLSIITNAHNKFDAEEERTEANGHYFLYKKESISHSADEPVRFDLAKDKI